MAAIRIVVGDAGSPTAVDTALATILEDGGNNTTDFISDETAEDVTGGISAVVFSPTVDAATVGGKYKNPSGIGVVSLRSDLTDDDVQDWHGGQGSTGSDDGVDITVAGEAHAVANGLTNAGNTHTLYGASVSQQMTTTTNFGGGTVIAFRGGSGSQRVLVAWGIGDQLATGTVCAGRHVLAGFASRPDLLNATGQALLLNAVEWAGEFGDYATDVVFGPEDDFATDQLATNFPNTYEDADAPIDVSGGRCTITLAASTAGTNYSGIATALGDFTGGVAFVQVARYPAANANLEAFFSITPGDGNNLVYFRVNNGTLACVQRVSGTTTVLATVGAVSLTDHRFLRIRESGDTTYWETSSDGSNWTERHSASNPITLTNVQAEVGAGTFASVASPGIFSLEAFNTAELDPIDHDITSTVDVVRDMGQGLGIDYTFDPIEVVRAPISLGIGSTSPLQHTLSVVRVGREMIGLGIQYELATIEVVRTIPVDAVAVTSNADGHGRRKRRRVAALLASRRW